MADTDPAHNQDRNGQDAVTSETIHSAPPSKFETDCQYIIPMDGQEKELDCRAQRGKRSDEGWGSDEIVV
jgi:hypothetical protein